MYYFDFLNLEAYQLIQKFKTKNKICFVHEILDEKDIWNLWLVLREDSGDHICIHYIWENWYSEEEEKEVVVEDKNRKSNYIFQNSIVFNKEQKIETIMDEIINMNIIL